MDNKSVFNAAVCIIGIIFLLIHTVNILLKKNRRKDENNLLIFVVFTIIHFATYLTFTFIKVNYSSDALIITFYTIFYIMNNLEALLLFIYTMSYVDTNKKKTKDVLMAINLSLFAVFVILDIINIFTRMYFTSVDGVYTRRTFMFFAQTYQFVILAASFILVLFDKELNVREKIGFSIYVFLPAISIVVQNFMPGYAIAYASLLLAVEILFLFLNVVPWKIYTSLKHLFRGMY